MLLPAVSYSLTCDLNHSGTWYASHIHEVSFANSEGKRKCAEKSAWGLTGLEFETC